MFSVPSATIAFLWLPNEIIWLSINYASLHRESFLYSKPLQKYHNNVLFMQLLSTHWMSSFQTSLATHHLLSGLTQKGGLSLGQRRQGFIRAGVFSSMPGSKTLLDNKPNGITQPESGQKEMEWNCWRLSYSKSLWGTGRGGRKIRKHIFFLKKMFVKTLLCLTVCKLKA